MPKEIITADQATAKTEELPISPPEPKKGSSTEQSVTFRTSNIGRIFLPNNEPFDFTKPLMIVSDPRLIAALTEVAGRTPTNISIHQP